jgi:DNA-binding transcriptional LysR family regulator
MAQDFSPTGLRVLVEVAQSGSFSAAARVLGYTQSAISRQVAGLEAVAGRPLFERRRDGVTLTPAGARLLARAGRVLDELDAAAREVAGPPGTAGPVRLGAFTSAVAGLLPGALAALPREVVVTVREGSTAALTRALRAGTLDLAVLAQLPPFRPPDAESPRLELTTLAEGERVIGVGPAHPFAARRAVEVGELAGQTWVAGRSESGESQLGVWPGLAERPDVRYVVRDWQAKLALVAAGLAITTLAPVALGALPDGVRVVAVRGEPCETRRMVLAHLPGPLPGAAGQVADALLAAARRRPGSTAEMAASAVGS